MNKRKGLGRRDDEEFDDIIDEPVPVKKQSSSKLQITEEISEKKEGEAPEENSAKIKSKTEEKKEASSNSKDVKKIKVLNGEAPVDDFVPNKDNYRVYGALGNQYTKTMVVSKAKENNNKFYIVQLLEHKTTKNYFTFYRWGRIGKDGSTKLNSFGTNVSQALMDFNNKVTDKMEGGEYKEVDIVYSNEEEEVDQDAKMQESLKNAKVDPLVADLIKTLFSIKMFTEQVKEVGYDVKRMPLGNLSKASIKSAYQCLRALSDLFIAQADSASKSRAEKQAATKNLKTKIETFSNEFYNLIPHDVGMTRMSSLLLDDIEKVNKKLELLDMLTKFKSSKNEDAETKSTNVIDAHYERLKTHMNILPMDSEEAKLIKKYAESTIAPNHQSLKIKIETIFSLKKDSEFEHFSKDINKRLLLWHGAKMSSFASILSQGLQLPPPEAPNTGYQFGKGIYFLDVFSKAILNCFAHLSNGVAYVLVSEVAVGTCNDLFNPDYNAINLPPGCDSTRGAGRQGPKQENEIKFESAGTDIPMGPIVNTSHPSSMLQFNEYVVYNKNQTRMRYLLKCTLGK